MECTSSGLCRHQVRLTDSVTGLCTAAAALCWASSRVELMLVVHAACQERQQLHATIWHATERYCVNDEQERGINQRIPRSARTGIGAWTGCRCCPCLAGVQLWVPACPTCT